MNDSVTFVLPVFNGVPYLQQAIASVFAQTDQDWRLLVIDDCSRDGSLEYARTFKDPRVTVARNRENYGLYGSLRRAIASIDSDWVSIVMQDDRLLPHYLNTMRALANDYPAEKVLWATEHTINEHGEVVVQGISSGRVEWIESGVPPWLGALKRGCYWTISGSFTRRDVFLAEPFRDGLPHCGDFEWLLRISRTCPLLYCELPLAELRRHPGQASATNLARAIDIAEQYQIIRDECVKRVEDLDLNTVIRIACIRARNAARRIPGAIAQRRLVTVGVLLMYVVAFLVLPVVWGRIALSNEAVESRA